MAARCCLGKHNWRIDETTGAPDGIFEPYFTGPSDSMSVVSVK